MKRNETQPVRPVESDFDKRVKVYMKESDKLCEKLKMEVRPFVNFKSGKVSWVARFAMFILRRTGAHLDTQFTNLKK